MIGSSSNKFLEGILYTVDSPLADPYSAVLELLIFVLMFLLKKTVG